MDPSISNLPNENTAPNDDRMNSTISEFNDKLKLGINDAADHRPGAGKSDGDDGSFAKDQCDTDQKSVISINAYHPPAASEEEDGQLWPRISELEDRPSSPTALQDIAIKQVISETSYQSPKLAKPNVNVHPQTEPAGVDGMFQEKISKAENQGLKQAEAQENDSKESLHLPKAGIRDAVHEKATLKDLAAHTGFPSNRGNARPPPRQVTDRPHQFPTPHANIMDVYMGSARGTRLSSVAEESESFARREFGDNELSYMSTHSSVNHAANLSSLCPNERALGDKRVSYKHNNYHQFNYNLKISQESSNDKFVSSKSAPAGTATRTGSAFGLFRRGLSEHSGLRMNKRTAYRPRKPKTLASTILWPLVKIKDSYVGCMMGIEGAGDLRGMAQGGTYGDSAWYFHDVPLSKSDSKNFG